MLRKEQKALNKLANAMATYEEKLEEYAELIKILEDKTSEVELVNMAMQDAVEVISALHNQERFLVRLLVADDDDSGSKSAILEVRAGAGGNEASLFADELLGMYRKFAEARDWGFEVINLSYNELGGLKEGIVLVSGKGAFRMLKHESGVHRVQRVPDTEASGRLHTSTVTVAVLPEVEDIDVKIDEADLKIETMRASGAGGQHVNRTESAVRLTHLPTGINVTIQEDRSQHRNKARAMQILRSRVFELEKQKASLERGKERRSQIGSGERNERVRTYNFPQNRITDHRVSVSLHDMEGMMNGDLLAELAEALLEQEELDKVASLEEYY
jgi:peptide chain release factor 1